MKGSFFVMCFVFASCGLFAQQNESKIKRVEFSSMSFGFGALISNEHFSNNLANFRKLAPKSEILAQDIEAGNESSFYLYTSSGPAFSAGAYFSVKNKEGKWSKYHPQVRIGISYANQTLLSNSFSKSEYFRVDTLTSNNSGQVFFVDSVKTDYHSMEYYREQLYVDAAFLVSSNPNNLLKFYGGLGISLGLTFNSTTFLYNNRGSYLDASVSLGNNYYYPDRGEYSEEIFLNKESFTALISLPIGLESKLSRRENNWAKCRVFFEGRPSLSYVSIPELASRFTTAGIWGMGFKYDF